jgi:hypothetical protein
VAAGVVGESLGAVLCCAVARVMLCLVWFGLVWLGWVWLGWVWCGRVRLGLRSLMAGKMPDRERLTNYFWLYCRIYFCGRTSGVERRGGEGECCSAPVFPNPIRSFACSASSMVTDQKNTGYFSTCIVLNAARQKGAVSGRSLYGGG